MARKRDKDGESPFEAADLAVAELADGAFDAAFDAVTMEDDGEPVDLAAEAEKEAQAKRQAEEAAARARAEEQYGDGPTRAERETGVGLERPPDDSGEDPSEESTIDLPPAAEEMEAPPAMPAVGAAPRVQVATGPSGARPPDAEDELAVQGRLEQLRLVEIVQMMEFGKKSAWVEVEPDDDGPKGELGFTNGQCAWALFGNIPSDEGFCSLCELKIGKFRIYYGYEPQLVNVESPTQFLLLEALRRIDEGSRGNDVDEEAEFEAAFMMDGGESDPS